MQFNGYQSSLIRHRCIDGLLTVSSRKRKGLRNGEKSTFFVPISFVGAESIF